MSGCSTSVNTELQDQHQEGTPPAYGNSSERAECSHAKPNSDQKDNKQEDDDGKLNVDEEEDEDEDVDFNPLLIDTHSAEASSSLSSEIEDLDTDAENGGVEPSVSFVRGSNEKHSSIRKNRHTLGDGEHGEEMVMQTTVFLGECGRNFDAACAATLEGGSVLSARSEYSCRKEDSASQIDVSNASDFSKVMVDMDSEGAISMRTRARYSLASFTLDELETFLQETDDEDDLQNVDDEEEYRKFLAAVLQGDDSENLQGNANADDEDEENDADFELELEELLESDHDEIEERHIIRRNRRQKASLERSKKLPGELNRPLRPLLPFVPMGSFPAFEENRLMLNSSPSYMPPVNNGYNCGFTPHQIGQLHCLIHEHVQLLIQVFSVCVLDPAKGDIAGEVKKLLLEMLQRRDQVLQCRKLPYPSFCFFPPYIHPSVTDGLHKTLPLHGSKEDRQWAFPSGTAENLHSSIILSHEKNKPQADELAGSSQAPECNSWVPYICGPVLSVMDVAPLRLAENYIEDVSSAARAYKRYQIELGFEKHFEKEPLFPLQNSPSAEHDGQGERKTNPEDSSRMLSSSSSNQMSRKTMAATLIEKSKNQSVALVPKEIAELAQRFWQLFNPALYPRKPPPAALTSRVLFTDAEDELLALGLMEYNTDWKAIQQRFLPGKSSHQIFVRQKNRASSKAPDNSIKAVRRLKNSPLTSEEIARIEMGLKKFKLDWISIWRSFVPYRDPSLLPRQWRIACGTQKSYKADATKKAKRHFYDLRRKTNRPSAPTRHSSSEIEGDSTDNANDETNGVDNVMGKGDEAYVHEAFLADWRSDNVTSSYPTHLSSQRGFEAGDQKVNSGQFPKPLSLKSSNSQVVLRPYRARKTTYARLVKLAPDLPPVNLPPSVRVMSQSAFKKSMVVSSTKNPGNSSRMGNTMAEGRAPHAGSTMMSQVYYSVKFGQFTSDSPNSTATDQHERDTQPLIHKHSAEDRGNPELQMHPLLFRAPHDGCLPYYPPSCSNTSFDYFSDKQPQLNLSLFHNPRHIRDAMNFLSKSSKAPVKHSSSSDVDFHPLLHDVVGVDSRNPTAKLPPDIESGQIDTSNQNHTCSRLTKPSEDGSPHASGTKMTSVNEKVNEVDLDIHLNFTSDNQEDIGSRSMNLDGTCTLASSTRGTENFERVKDSEEKKGSAPDGISHKFDLSDLPLVQSRDKGGGGVAENMHDEPLSEIVMEQEELSDSDEEFGKNLEFEHEEMDDSEGDDTSDSEQLVNIPDEEPLLDETNIDIDSHWVINPSDICEGIICSTSDGHTSGLDLTSKEVNIKHCASPVNPSSHPAVSLLSNPQKAAAKYDFGPFGAIRTCRQNQLSDCPERSRGLIKPLKRNVPKRSKDAQDYPGLDFGDSFPRKPRKRACTLSPSSSIVKSIKENSSSRMDVNVDKSEHVSEDAAVN